MVKQPHRAGCFRRRSSAQDGQQQATAAASGPLAQVLRGDLTYLEQRVGGDLQTMAAVHGHLVAILNPIAGSQVARLEEQIAGLQQELAVAHVQARLGGGLRGPGS